MFRVPANTPVFVQPLDAEGKAQQQMRSWYVAMPGETASCIGCHERQNSGPPNQNTLAAHRRPERIAEWFGPVRGFSFDREVQPVLDRRCAGCHDGRPTAGPDLRAKRLHPDYSEPYSPAYMALQKYVRRPGYESDNHMHSPAEFDADTSVLVQILKKDHYGVRLAPQEWERLYAWIDLNIPYPANWRESHRPPRDEQVATRVKHQKLFAGVDDRDEEPLPLPPVAAFEAPPAQPAAPAAPALAGWPFSAEQAAAMQKAAGEPRLELDLGDGVKMQFVLVPAGRFVMGDAQGFPDEQAQAVVSIDRPFYLGRLEVTNEQYACFDRRHDSAYIEGRGKDRTTRGTPANRPDQPVIRISWNEALAFCEWLTHKSGARCTLPTEAQWEWACRAGAAGPFCFGPLKPGDNNLANVADSSVAAWNYGRAEPGYNDGELFSAKGGRYPANAWGLTDMHGNVAEWCLSTYRPYPWRLDGRDDPRTDGPKVVRGGSWADPFRFATSAFRWRYPAHQPVYNVGFRVLCQPRVAPAVANR
jgi:formylglycine-generating enzyme required for sulfatase activity